MLPVSCLPDFTGEIFTHQGCLSFKAEHQNEQLIRNKSWNTLNWLITTKSKNRETMQTTYQRNNTITTHAQENCMKIHRGIDLANPHSQSPLKAYGHTINQNRYHRLHKQSQQSKEILRILRSKTAIGTVIFYLEIWQISLADQRSLNVFTN